MKKVTSVLDVCMAGEEQDFFVELDQYEQKESKYVDHANQVHEDKFCPIALRGNCRGDFAQKHLFGSGFRSSAREEEEDDAQSCSEYQDNASFSDEQDLEESLLEMQEADLSDPMTDPSQPLNGSSFASNFNRYSDNLDTEEGPGSFNQLSSHLNTM